MTTASMSVKRPGVLTLVAVYLWIVAIASLLVGALVAAGSWSDDVIAETGRTASELRIVGFTELIMGVIVLVTAIALSSGSRSARTLVAVVAALRIAVTVFIVAYAHTAGYVIAGALHVLLPIVILWVLYGNDRVEAYFEQ